MKTLILIMLTSMLSTSAFAQTRSECGPDDRVDDCDAEVVAPKVRGVDIRVLARGSGAAAKRRDTVDIHYTVWLQSDFGRGSMVDSSKGTGPFSFRIGSRRVIKGLSAGVVGMRVGEKRELIISPSKAYGSRGAGNVIPPGATLVYEVELLSIK